MDALWVFYQLIRCSRGRLWLLAVSSIFLVSPCFSQEQAAELDLSYLSSEKRSIVYGSRLVDEGRFDDAIVFFEKAVEKHPRSDALLFNFAVAHYESRNLEKAESLFMQSIRLNPLNDSSIAYVNAIREINSASVSLRSQQIRDVMVDKLGDIIVFALGVFMGTLMSGTFKKFKEWWFIRKCRRTFMQGNYEYFADLLEIQIASNELGPLRDSLVFMIENKGVEKALSILRNYVNSEENLGTLTRMIELQSNE